MRDGIMDYAFALLIAAFAAIAFWFICTEVSFRQHPITCAQVGTTSCIACTQGSELTTKCAPVVGTTTDAK